MKVEIRYRNEQVGLSNERPVVDYGFEGIPEDSKVHVHDFHSVWLITSGTAELLTETASTPLTAGSVVVGVPGTARQFKQRQYLCGRGVFYLTEWLLGDDLLREQKILGYLFFGTSRFPALKQDPIRVFSASPEVQAFLIQSLNEIHLNYTSAKPSLFDVKLCFLRFLNRLALAYVEEWGGAGWENFRDEVWAAINQIELWVRQHQDFEMPELARWVGCSPGYLHRIFSEATGMSPMAYFQRRRMQAASQLLLNSDANITEIAYRIGCADSAHFSRLFHREMKMTPSAYRKRFRSPT